MQSMLDNLINGNLKDAKRQAKRFSLQAIYRYCRSHYFQQKAAAAAIYLKYPSQRTWDIFCKIQDSNV